MRVLQLVNTRRSFFDTQVRALERAGIDCDVLEVPGVHSTESTHSVGEYARFYASLLSRTGEYDLVHANYGLLGPLALAQPTRPVVLTLWGSDVMGEAGWLTHLSSISARLADAAIVPSPVMAPHLPAETTLVPFGVDTDRFRPIDRTSARERVGWPAEERTVLFPYPPEREVKNYSLAAAVVDSVGRDARLRTMSGVPHEEVPFYMNASDAVLVTSRRESGPMVVKEAAACNVPVISTDVGFVRETLADVANSYVCETPDRLAARLADVLDRRPRSDGRKTCPDLSEREMGDQLVDVYESVV